MQTAPEQKVLDAQDLIDLFEQSFLGTFNTTLVGNASEPLYTPASSAQPAYILFTRDYFASALHEIAHWCIAGEQRRQLEDYGYWYEPDGRTTQQQKLFETVEVAPQALEWIFSRCCRAPFRVSADNLDGEEGASKTFKQAVYQQVESYLQKGLPKRAEQFAQALAGFYRDGHFPDFSEFNLSML